jgi:hypothetical protein
VQYVDVLTASEGRYGFYDPLHLNSAGKRYFSAAIGGVISNVLASTPASASSVPGPRRPDVDAPDVPASDVDVPDAPSAGAPDAPAPPADEPEPPPIVIPAPDADTLDDAVG